MDDDWSLPLRGVRPSTHKTEKIGDEEMKTEGDKEGKHRDRQGMGTQRRQDKASMRVSRWTER